MSSGMMVLVAFVAYLLAGSIVAVVAGKLKPDLIADEEDVVFILALWWIVIIAGGFYGLSHLILKIIRNEEGANEP